MDGLLVFWEDGRQVISSYDSDNNCDGTAFMAWLESRDQNTSGAKKAAKAEAARRARKQKMEDVRVLGPLYAELAQVIRKNRAEAQRAAKRPVLKRHRPRRRLKGD